MEKNNELIKTVLSDKVANVILEDIFNKRYKPGDRLVESKLAKELGVSQAPVREAIKQLEGMGLVIVEPYKGTKVREYTKKDMEDFTIVRATIEGLAIRLAIDKISNEEIEQLQDMVIKMEIAAAKHDYDERAAINHEFHKTIINASNNQLLNIIVNQMRLNIWSSTFGKNSKMNPVEMAERHQMIVDVINEGNKEKAEKIMYNHIMDSYKNYDSDFYSIQTN